MEPQTSHTRYDAQFVRNMVESSVRIGVVFILLAFAFDIIKPFIVPLIWGGIIAIAAFPLVKWLEGRLGGRRGMASTLITLVFIGLLVVPFIGLTESLLSTAKTVSANINQGALTIPSPPEKVQNWPLIGEQVYGVWQSANDNLEAVLNQFHPQIKALVTKGVKALGSGALSVLMFVISLAIAGAFMAYADAAGAAAHRLFTRLGGLHPGGEWAELSVATVRSVLQGVVGVAVIQATLCAIGMFVMGIPGAPVWSAIILFLAIAQLPPLIVVGPMIAYAYGSYEATSATIFTIYMLVAGFIDTPLKPLLMGRGLDIPMPVILIGAIGGMLASGIIGLFEGAVILSILYKLFTAWLEQESL